ncbi:MAG: hypothetical protein QOJ91_3082 [Sphingomonadales bacterium]|jgi:hypothetical protein|nr:hypothetical protein [Sphingomonadales bacterium]
MTQKTDRHADEAREPGVAALEGSIQRTQILLARFRKELAAMVAKVHRDVDQLRAAALGDGLLLPPDDPEALGEWDIECRLAGMEAAREGPILTRAMIDAIVDERMNARFAALDQLIRANLNASRNPLQNLGLGRSRLRR